MIEALFFYLFSAVMLGAGAMVVISRNPVYSVLFLILAFFNAAGLFVLIGAEFIAMLLVVVYVGAVAVLFLFVVMMLDIDFAELRSGILHYAPVGALIGIVLLAELIVVVGGSFIPTDIAANTAMPMPADTSSVKAIGDVIYTHYAYFFQVAGLILLVAMIGAIVLTLKHRPDVKRQNIAKQVARTPESAHETVKVKPGQGI